MSEYCPIKSNRKMFERRPGGLQEGFVCLARAMAVLAALGPVSSSQSPRLIPPSLMSAPPQEGPLAFKGSVSRNDRYPIFLIFDFVETGSNIKIKTDTIFLQNDQVF